jgi:GNAT superfamily N-acetyltransferase
MAGMGARSLYQRFHSPKPRLTARDRAYLTNVDGRDHIAFVALTAAGEPVGVARAVRLRDDPAAAELGVEVVDSHQDNGLGTELTARLARRAAAAGIERFVAEVLAQSRLVEGLLRRGWRISGRDGPVVTLEIHAWPLAQPGRAARSRSESDRELGYPYGAYRAPIA